VVVFKDVPYGRYAAVAFHDEDGNGQMRKNWVGMPKEGIGASRDAQGLMGPPSFRAASFGFSSEQRRVRVKMIYL
jgi:uncharacterized protein (DUF2141 family)